MYIPVFDIKDSFIIKHVLKYDTSCDLDLPYKIMFIDYDLARKSQTINAENFSGITFDFDFSNVTSIHFDYFNENDIIYFDGNLTHEDVFSGSTFTKTSNYEQYYVDSGYSHNIGETVEIQLYQKENESGTTFYEHFSYVPNDIWVVSGLTSQDTQWIVTGMTSSTGYTSGYTNWFVDTITPVFKYESEILNTGSTYIRIDRKLEDYIINNLLTDYDDLYYHIRSLNHSDKTYYDLYNILIKKDYIKNFNITLNTNNIILTPIYNVEDIYFNYDAFDIYTTGSTSTSYSFETNCLYNKYNLELFFDQFDDINSGTTLYDTYSTTTINVSGYTFGDYYMDIEIPDTTDIKEYTYIELETNSGNTYNVIVTNVTGNTVTIITPLNILAGENIVGLRNLTTVREVSNVLQKTYENYEQNEYRKHHIQIQKKIYTAYAQIINLINDNQYIRLLITGLIFENSNKIMVLKVFDPADFTDDRLLYEPIEIVRIGKDRKTSIPISVVEFTKGISADEINANIYSVYLFDPRVENVLVIDANAT